MKKPSLRKLGMAEDNIVKEVYRCPCGNNKFFRKSYGLVCTKCRKILKNHSKHKIKSKKSWWTRYKQRLAKK